MHAVALGGGGGIHAVALGGLGVPTTPSKKARIYTEISTATGKSRVEKRAKTGCGCNEKDGSLTQEMMDSVEDVVDQMNDYMRQTIDPAVRKVTVNFTSRVVEYIGPDGRPQFLPIARIQDAALRSFAMETSKEVENRHTTDPNVSSNRPLNCPAPFAKTVTSWEAAHCIDPKTYMTEDHADLDAALRLEPTTQALADTAPAKIKAAVNLRNHFIQALQAQLQQVQQQLDVLTEDQREEKLAKLRQQKELEKLIAKLQSQQLDTKVLFHNISYANNALLGFTDAERVERAGMAKDTMRADLSKNSQGRFTARIADGAMFWKTRAMATATDAYVEDTGDMFQHDRWKHDQQVQDRGGALKGASAEEFLFNAVATLKAPETDPNILDAMSSLGLPEYEQADIGLRALVGQAFIAARRATNTQYDLDVAATTGQPLAQQTTHLFP